MRRPESNRLFAWIEAAMEDLADSVERLNQDLDRRETDQEWTRKAFNDSWDIVSLRRWSFILPGGGALRGGRPPKPIPPATRGGPGTLAKSQAERAARQAQAAKPVRPAPEVALTPNTGRSVSEI